MALPEERQKRGESAQGAPPSAVSNGRRDEKAPIDGSSLGAGGGGLWNSGPRTRISKQLIGGNADELKRNTGEDGEELGERVSPS